MPVLADGTSSVFYPGKLLFASPLGYAWNFKLYTLLHVLLAAGASWLLARRWGGIALRRRPGGGDLCIWRQRPVSVLQPRVLDRGRLAAAGLLGSGSDVGRKEPWCGVLPRRHLGVDRPRWRSADGVSCGAPDRRLRVASVAATNAPAGRSAPKLALPASCPASPRLATRRRSSPPHAPQRGSHRRGCAGSHPGLAQCRMVAPIGTSRLPQPAIAVRDSGVFGPRENRGRAEFHRDGPVRHAGAGHASRAHLRVQCGPVAAGRTRLAQLFRADVPQPPPLGQCAFRPRAACGRRRCTWAWCRCCWAWPPGDCAAEMRRHAGCPGLVCWRRWQVSEAMGLAGCCTRFAAGSWGPQPTMRWWAGPWVACTGCWSCCCQATPTSVIPPSCW